MASVKNVKKSNLHKLQEHVYTTQKSLHGLFNEDKYRKYGVLSLVCYDEDLLERWLCLVRPSSYAYIEHNCDVIEDGTRKETHYHCIAKFKGNDRPALTSLGKIFKTSNVIVDLPFDEVASYEYLIHKNSPDKYQYDPKLIHSFVREGEVRVGISKEEAYEDANARFLDDLQSLNKRELAKKYGRDYMKNSRTYHMFIGDMEYQEECQALAEVAEEVDIAIEQLNELGIDPHEFIVHENTKFFSRVLTLLNNQDRVLRYSDLATLYIDCQNYFMREVRAYIEGERYLHEGGEVDA